MPDLGDSTSGIISTQQEFELGRAWIGMFRSRVQTLDDPELLIYLEELLYDLAEHSQLRDHRLELVIVNNPSLNAFAVPGGVIGVHTGLFRFTENEHQLASILSHELAHLSQRHFARGLENRKVSTFGTMAGLMAGILLAATVGSDAGMAALTLTQAASMESSLRYSRQNEQEADRIGIETLFQAQRDPAAAPNMFERMLASTRYSGHKPPEFLMTHPLTENRVADARNRSNSYPQRQYPLRPDFDFMRARVMLWLDANPTASIQRFKGELEHFSMSKEAARYGLALAYSRQGDHQKASDILEPVLAKNPHHFRLKLAAIELTANQELFDQALQQLIKLEPLYGNHYAVQRYKAEMLLKSNQFQASERVLEALSKSRKTDPDVWFQLAEVSGLSGDITGVHKARAEYFILTGIYDKAKNHLEYAKELSASDYREHAILEARLKEVQEIIKKAEKL